MGTTRDALVAGGGRFGMVLAIEGYSRLITSAASSADITAMLTAWSGSGWSSAITGLSVHGRFEQSITPWSTEPNVSSITFAIAPDEDDTFAQVVFRSVAAAETRLTDPLAATAASGALSGKSFGNFASSGVAYVGPSAIEYTSKTGTQTLNFGAGAAGVYAPFPINGGTTFPRPVTIAAGKDYDIGAPLKITSAPTSWAGRWVGLWLHRIVGNNDDGNLAWDTKAQAERLFAGKIVEIREGEDGRTYVECESIQAALRDTAVLSRQFVGRAKEGIRLRTGDKVWAAEVTTTTRVDAISSALEVVASGASGSYEINAGYLSTDDFISKINSWMHAENAATFGGTWSCRLAPTDAGFRFRADVEFATSAFRIVEFRTNSADVFEFLGFDQPKRDGGGLVVSLGDLEDEFSIISDSAPYRVKPFQEIRGGFKLGQGLARPFALQLEDDAAGAWWNQQGFLPEPARSYAPSGDCGFLMLPNGAVFLAHHNSDTDFDDIVFGGAVAELFPGATLPEENAGKRVGEEGDYEVRQLVFLQGKFVDIVTRLLASIEGNGVNHATYDAFPFGAAIPWDCLGDAFLDSAEALADAGRADTITVIIDKPTKLSELLAADLLLRWAYPVWKDGYLQLVSPQTPNASSADHTFDVSTKGAPAGDRDDQRIATRITDEYVRNVIKIEHSRNLKGEYTGSAIIIRNEASISLIGDERPVTIKARNSFALDKSAGTGVESLAADLYSRIGPSYGRPIRMYRRTINGTLWHAAPGDTGALSDEFARNPTTGRRGVSGRGVTVLSVSYQIGDRDQQPYGEVDLMFADEDRTFPLAPTAEVDETHDDGDFDAGWDPNTKTLKLKEHAHSESGDDVDVSLFTAGDAVRILEIDPEDPDSAADFADTVVSVSAANNEMVLTEGFGSGARPALDNTKLYRVTFDEYTSTQTAQKLFAYQADDDDGQIQNTIEPNLYGEQKHTGYSTVTGTEAPALYNAGLYGEGRAVCAGMLDDLGRMANALTQHKLRPAVPFTMNSGFGTTTLADDWACLATFPFLLQGAAYPLQRKLVVAPMFVLQNTAGAGSETTVTVRVTSSAEPPASNGTGGIINVIFGGLTNSATWSRENSTTTRVIETAAEIVPVPDRGNILTWITVEAQQDNSNTSTPLQLEGFSQLELGAPE